MTGEKVSLLTCNSFIGQYINTVGGVWIGGKWKGGIVISARCVFHFIREYEKSGARCKY